MNHNNHDLQGIFMVMKGLAKLHAEGEKEVKELEDFMKKLELREPLIPPSRV